MGTVIHCGVCRDGFAPGLVADRFGGACPRCLARFVFGDGSAIEPDPERTAATGAGAEAIAPLSAGARLAGCEIVRMLGRGGMGVVYEARQIRLDRKVAVKVLDPRLAARPGFTERFEREAKALASLRHPHIVGVHDHGVEGGICYLVMEFVEGPSLRERLARGRLSPEEAIAMIGPVCEALEYAHSRGIVHRDVKPENILLDASGRPRIADFGLAKIAGSPEGAFRTETRAVMGTPRYMAPEQYEDMRRVDHRADVYALGVVLYEMLMGEVPMGHFERPSQRIEIDVRLDQVVLRALAREPELRYQRAIEIKTDLDTLASLPCRMAAAPRSPRPVSEGGALAMICGMAGLLGGLFIVPGVAFGVAGLVLSRPEPGCRRNAMQVIGLMLSILGICFAVVALVAVVAAIAIPAISAARLEAQKAATRENAALIASALEEYREDHGRYPADLSDLALSTDRDTERAYLAPIPRDGFDESFLYEPRAGGADYVLTSPGADGRPGGKGYDADLVIHGPDDSRRERSIAVLSEVRTALDLYRIDRGRYPESLAELPGDEVDAWSNPLVYETSADGQDYELRSLGGDGEPGGEGAAADLVATRDRAPAEAGR